jgi:hypothetical protein
VVTVTIKKPDGSTYWVEHFNEPARAQAWVDDEKKRPYWKPTFTVEVDDRTAEENTAAAQRRAQIEKWIGDREAAIQQLRNLDPSTITTIAQVKALLFDIVRILR